MLLSVSSISFSSVGTVFVMVVVMMVRSVPSSSIPSSSSSITISAGGVRCGRACAAIVRVAIVRVAIAVCAADARCCGSGGDSRGGSGGRYILANSQIPFRECAGGYMEGEEADAERENNCGTHFFVLKEAREKPVFWQDRPGKKMKGSSQIE